MNNLFNHDDDNMADYDYEDEMPQFSAGGLLGWLGRRARHDAERRASRWIYWRIPLLGSFLRYRQAGPLGRVGIIIQLLIQVAILTGLALVLFYMWQGGSLDTLLSSLTNALPR